MKNGIKIFFQKTAEVVFLKKTELKILKNKTKFWAHLVENVQKKKYFEKI